MNHTPGPWEAYKGARKWWAIDGPEEGADSTFRYNEADARLIAAAPDLLAAAQNALRELEAYRILLDGCEAWIDASVDEELRNAIAKARGES